MQEKAFGSLSGSLLARKGGAKPAMRPQAFRFDQGDVAVEEDDCGWNDMGDDSDMDAGMLTAEQRALLLPKDGFSGSITSASLRAADQHDEGREPAVARQQRDLESRLSETGGEGAAADREVMAGYDEDDGNDGDERAGPQLFELDEEDAAEQSEFLKRLASESTLDAAELEEQEDALYGPALEAPAKAAADTRMPSGSEAGIIIRPKAPSQVKTRGATANHSASAFTLRLDRMRYLKLRMACAFAHTSAQKLMSDALDEYLERHHADLPKPH